MAEDLRNRTGSRRYAVCCVAVGVVLSVVLGLVTLGQSVFSFAYSQNALLPHYALLALAAAALALLVVLRVRFAAQPYRAGFWRRLPFVWAAALFCVQLVVARSVWFYPGWDVQSVYEAAGQIATGKPFSGDYFRLCPNNAPLTLLLAVPLWAAGRLGLAVPYAALPYTGELMVNLACLFAALCVWRLTPSRFARLGALVLCTFWIALSLTATVPYTDAFSILFPALALYLWLRVKNPSVKWLAVSFVCFFGASIKPTTLIFLLALLLISVLGALRRGSWNRARWRRAGAVCLAVMLGAAPAALWQAEATAYLAGSAQPQEQLSETHYLMLGMNGETYGGHSPEDVAYSSSFPTLALRRQANLARAWERVSGRTFEQNVFFFSVKAYKAFSDGSLAANQSYLTMSKPARSDVLSRFLRAVYYQNGALNPLWTTFAQFLWMGVLLLCLAALFGRAGRSKITAALALTLFGALCYLLLFEVWPRYLYLFAPLFTVLAALGAEHLRLPRKPRR
jgi:4-amino-4-deoxy-L-arabinose transferase-like glycosyltransferase